MFERRDVDRLIDVSQYFITIILQGTSAQSGAKKAERRFAQAGWRLKPDEPCAILMVPEGEDCL
jgi:hypothetical protein